MDTTEYKVSKLLFIKGAFIKDCIQIDDIFEQQLIEQLGNENTTVVYDKIPSIFTGIKSWLTQTNVKCWYCDLNFSGVPVFIPKLIEPSNTPSGYIIGTYGCFCSFSCALHFIIINIKTICDKLQSTEMLLFLYKIFHGYNIKEIFPSPSKYDMVQYGGDIEPIAYKKLINELKKKMSEAELRK